ncbi:MAG TPA: PIN domain-containing protein [Candidatus Angelobacter sp.]|jgi:predicted nucleic acid-binding protein|nr:PIN domain-containing protein [Candidatus Angelobacter sp.]
MIFNQNNEYSVVLDACVLVPMPLCDTLLHLAEDPAFYRPLWSGKILKEVGDALEKKLGLNEMQRVRRLRVMQEAFPEAMVVIPPKLEETFDCPDKDDRHVVACAVKGQANAIITLNKKDFPPECLEERSPLPRSGRIPGTSILFKPSVSRGKTRYTGSGHQQTKVRYTQEAWSGHASLL